MPASGSSAAGEAGSTHDKQSVSSSIWKDRLRDRKDSGKSVNFRRERKYKTRRTTVQAPGATAGPSKEQAEAAEKKSEKGRQSLSEPGKKGGPGPDSSQAANLSPWAAPHHSDRRPVVSGHPTVFGTVHTLGDQQAKSDGFRRPAEGSSYPEAGQSLFSGQ